MVKIEKVTTIESDGSNPFQWIQGADKLPVFVRYTYSNEIYIIAQVSCGKFAPIGLSTRNRYCEGKSAPELLEYLDGDENIEYLDKCKVVLTYSEPIE